MLETQFAVDITLVLAICQLTEDGATGDFMCVPFRNVANTIPFLSAMRRKKLGLD